MKQLKVAYFFIGLLTLTLAGALWANAYWMVPRGTQLEQIKARGELRVSTLNAAPSYSTDNGVPSGIDYELASMFADYLGVKLKIEPRSNISQMFSSLQNNEVDILAAALIYNPERMKDFRVGPAYYSVSQQVVYRQGTRKPRNLANIPGQLTVIAGSAHIATLNQLQRTKYPELSWDALENQSSRELLRQVASGAIPYTVADSVTVSAFQRVYPQLAVAFDISEEEPVMWYLQGDQDDSLYAAVLDFFSQITEDSTLARLEEKYLGHMVGGFDYVDSQTFVNAIDKTLPEFQPLFEKYAPKGIDWKLLAAVSYQESHWDPQATSSTGVRGMMMLTRSTAESLGVEDRLDPEQSIRGGAAYLEHLLSRIPPSIPEDERIWFALTSYNMGFSHMQDARRLTSLQKANPDSWADVKKRLPMLTQKRYYTLTRYGYAKGYQASRFVENIRRYKISLDDYLREKERRLQRLRLEEDQRNQLGLSYPAVQPDQVPNQ